jgi:hypothetical protein
MRTPPPNLLNFDYFLPAADSGMTGMGFLSSIVGLYANQLSLVHAKNNPLFRPHSPLQILNLASADV